MLTFFSDGSWTVSANLLRALRICDAAMLVEVFSKAWLLLEKSNMVITWAGVESEGSGLSKKIDYDVRVGRLGQLTLGTVPAKFSIPWAN